MASLLGKLKSRRSQWLSVTGAVGTADIGAGLAMRYGVKDEAHHAGVVDWVHGEGRGVDGVTGCKDSGEATSREGPATGGIVETCLLAK